MAEKPSSREGRPKKKEGRPEQITRSNIEREREWPVSWTYPVQIEINKNTRNTIYSYELCKCYNLFKN